tara:strand:- start:1381 stop:1629 length:249 start_codon:yes stop_codon:yes gene_type:complete
MEKNPENYSGKELKKIVGLNLKIGIGLVNDAEAKEYIEGQILGFEIESFPPYSPRVVRIDTGENTVKEYNIFELKSFEIRQD